MARRQSVHIDGFVHSNPIPNASRIGNIVASGVILGRDSETDTVPETLEAQCALVFRHMRAIVEAAGGTPDDILKVTVWLRDPSDREALNAEWTRMFPDADARPARHTQPAPEGGPYLIQCDFLAVIGN